MIAEHMTPTDAVKGNLRERRGIVKALKIYWDIENHPSMFHWFLPIIYRRPFAIDRE